MRILDQPLPGTRHDTCLRCGAFTTPGEWIDFEIDIEYEGWIGICGNCAREVAALIGCPPSDAIAKLTEDNRRLKAKVDSLEATAHRVKELL